MTDKIILAPLASLQNDTTAINTINNNSVIIEAAMNNTLSRDGTAPNQMEADFDMNGNRIFNLPPPVNSQEPLRLQDLTTFIDGGTVTNIPPGGTINQVLAKESNADYDVHWSSESTNVLGGTNIAVTGGSPVTVSTIATPTFTSVTTPALINTGTLTLPTSTDTLVGRATTDTLTNKTLTTPTVTNPTVSTGTFTSPTLITPALGTPASGVMTNVTGTAANLTAGHVTTNANLTGDVTSVGNATTLATVNSNVGTFGSATATPSVTVNGKGLITAASSVTVTPALGSITGLGTNVATFLATPTSANLIAAMTDETGTGANVFANTPTLVTPVLGAATGTSVNLSSGIIGTTAGGNAASGFVGEYLSSFVAIGTVPLTTGTSSNLTSLSLTAGDWDVHANLMFNTGAGTVITTLQGSISTVSATLNPSIPFYMRFDPSGAGVTYATNILEIPPVFCRINITSTTTIFLVVAPGFTASTLSAGGSIQARRVR